MWKVEIHSNISKRYKTELHNICGIKDIGTVITKNMYLIQLQLNARIM